MKAGKLDREIAIERSTETINAAGVVNQTWTTLANMRAQIVTVKVDDASQAYGSATESTFVFRPRWLDGVTLDDRVSYAGQAYVIKEIVEIQRRRGLEIRVERYSK